ncbi:conserved hypothetical protein [Trichinella spiralis]|uniref:hypothetical protein n=1 Tax=Trichinella spiralis TaxID=6334 RepID=UPI0001EFC6AB|nr:conserved hypothetical protein [Trichinella spiralis]
MQYNTLQYNLNICSEPIKQTKQINGSRVTEQQSNEWCGKIVRERQAIYFSQLKEKLKVEIDFSKECSQGRQFIDIVALEQMKVRRCWEQKQSVLELFYACQLLAVEQLTGNVAAIAAKVEDANGENDFHCFQTTKRPCFNIYNLNNFDFCNGSMLLESSTCWTFSTNNPALLTIYYFLQPWTVNGLFDTLVQVSECLKMNSDIDKISLHFYNCCFGSNQGIGCLMLKRTMMAFYPLIQ